jgi:ABC-type transport system involved in multi-copper enzyme maturation permease subunit
MIAALRRAISFPLLGKDLAERAARGRTYWTRLAFGVGLAGWFAVEMFRLSNGAQVTPSEAGFALMGIGNELFGALVLVLCWAILLLQPALMAGTITYEKERASLDLLLLTNASPTKLLLEKFLAGLVPMATLLLFGLPLGAVAYAYGGVTPQMLAVAISILFGTWLQTGAFALLCSAWCRTTTGAVVAAYLGLPGFYLVSEYGFSALRGSQQQSPVINGWSNYPPLTGIHSAEDGGSGDSGLMGFLNFLGRSDPSPAWQKEPWAEWVPHTLFPLRTLKNSGLLDFGDDPASHVVEFEGFINYGSPIQAYSTNALGEQVKNVITPSVINQPIFSTRAASTYAVAAADDEAVVQIQSVVQITPVTDGPAGKALGALGAFIVRQAWLPMTALLFLIASRAVLLRRAVTAPRRPGLRLVMWLDAAVDRLNRRLGGVTFAAHKTLPPAGRPILWREMHRGLFGQPRHLMRMGTVWFILLTFAALPGMIRFEAGHQGTAAIAYLRILGIAAALVVAFILLTRAATVIASERTNQTLEILLTAPMSRSEMVAQKARPLRWLSLALWLPLCALAAMLAWGGQESAELSAGFDDRGVGVIPPVSDYKVFGSYASAWFQFGVAALAMGVLFWQMRWLGLWCGLRVVSRGRAILIALGVCSVWIIGPECTARMMEGLLGHEWFRSTLWVRQISPLGLLDLCMHGTTAALSFAGSGVAVGATNVMLSAATVLCLHASIALTLRTTCLWYAAKCLHRG